MGRTLYKEMRENKKRKGKKNNVIQGDERKQKKLKSKKKNVIQGDGEKRKDKKTKKRFVGYFFECEW